MNRGVELRFHQTGDVHRVGKIQLLHKLLQQGNDIGMGTLIRRPAATHTTAVLGWSKWSSFRVVEDKDAWWGTLRMSQGVAVSVSHM